MKDLQKCTIAIIGLGYVGLPLANEFSKKYSTIGFDIDAQRVAELRDGYDRTEELSSKELVDNKIKFTSDKKDLLEADIYIATVPTPIDHNLQPDLSPLISVSKLIGEVISIGNLVIYESTVYPGATEDVCIPIVEEVSNLKLNTDFFCGYSPERINPGDKSRPVSKIIKVTSGSTEAIAQFVDKLYSSIIVAGTFKAKNIRVAEASKVIENTQRDVNIALINELSMIFDALDIPTHDVLEAAATKWNFINLKPGLVGGHCIGVDPYYLMHKSLSAGYVPDIIRKSREINDGMAKHLSVKFIKKMIDNNILIKNSKVLVLGYSFKEDCPDTRNTKVFDLVRNIESFGPQVFVYDPVVLANKDALPNSINFIENLKVSNLDFDACFVAVGHTDFKELNINDFLNDNSVIYDFKNLYN